MDEGQAICYGTADGGQGDTACDSNDEGREM